MSTCHQEVYHIWVGAGGTHSWDWEEFLSINTIYSKYDLPDIEGAMKPTLCNTSLGRVCFLLAPTEGLLQHIGALIHIQRYQKPGPDN